MGAWTLLGGGIHGDCLFRGIISVENLFTAWREFRRGKRTRRDVQEFEFSLEDSIFTLHDALAKGVYQHSSYTPFRVCDTKPRHIHKATIADRLVHHALFRVLNPIFDGVFIGDSYSCRKGKGTHAGLVRLKHVCRRASVGGRRVVWGLKCDVRRFFDSVDHATLLELIERRVSCKGTLHIVRYILESFHTTPGKGLPLGNVTSQLFANVYLHELDRFVKHKLRARYYVRYCDDFLILGHDPVELRELQKCIAEFLHEKLKLELHPHKVSLRTWRMGIDWVGYVVRPQCTVLRTTTRRRMMRQVSGRNKASYLGMLGHCNGYKLRQEVLASLDAIAQRP